MNNQLEKDNNNTYCVPAALSILTGLFVGDCVSLIRDHLGDQAIEGIYLPIALSILKGLGYQVENASFIEGNTIFTAALGLFNTYLISTGKHAIVIKNGIIFDNKYPDGISPKNYPFKRVRIKQAYRITK